MTDRPDCRTPGSCIAKTPGKHCPGCTISAKFRDPAFREKRRAAFAAKLRDDPDFRAKHVAANKQRMEKWRARPETRLGQAETSRANLALANTPENTAKRNEAIRAAAYRGIPRDRWDEVRRLARQMPAAEAKRIVLDDIAEQQRRAEAAMTPHERNLARIAAGARLVDKPVIRRAGYEGTIGGVASGLL